jgi:hypothetical protein
MKKLFLTCLLVVQITVVFAPESGFVTIIVPTPVLCTNNLQNVLQAIIQVESGKQGSTAYNPAEPLAAGILQEWPILVDDVNRIIGFNRYTYEDRLNDKLAIEMFWIYQTYYNPEMNMEKMCRIWCGGPDGYKQSGTLAYFEKVKQELTKIFIV